MPLLNYNLLVGVFQLIPRGAATVKKSQSLFVLSLAAILILPLAAPNASTNALGQRKFQIKEYELLHDVLHPLQHEALPQGDFLRIRMMASEIVTRGKAIVKLGVPEAPKANRREFAKTLRRFDKALARFKNDARTGSNTRLKESYSAVYDSFEKLADLVPTVYPGGSPPTVTLNCLPSKVEAGSKITLTASTVIDENLAFLWTVEGGKILIGQGTPTITIDTTGLAGQAISVAVEVNDGFGHVAIANCVVQISASK